MQKAQGTCGEGEENKRMHYFFRARLVAWPRIVAHWHSGASTFVRSERDTGRNWSVVW
jgi:hypothetical protein